MRAALTRLLRRRPVPRVAPLVALLGLLCACGSGGPGVPAPGTPHDFSGDWILYVTDDERDCGGDVEVRAPQLATAVQTGNELTVTTGFGTFTGTIEGQQAVVTGTYPDGLGYTTFTAWVLTAQGAGFDGHVDWTYSLSATGLPVICQGTSTASGVRPPPPVTVESAALPAIESGDPIFEPMAIDGGCGGPYAVQLVSGRMPEGVSATVSSIPGPTGDLRVLLIEGVPLEFGAFSFTLVVSDPTCLFATGIAIPFTWQIAKGPFKIVGASPPLIPVAEYVHPLKYDDVDALEGVVFGAFVVRNLLVINGTPPYACEVLDDPDDPDDGPLPDGIVVSDGACDLLGSAMEQGPAGRPFRLTIRVTDDDGATTSRKLQFAVLTPPPIIATSSLSGGTVGVPYADSVQVVDGIPPFVWSVTAGSLPLGLMLDAGSGAITGTPQAAGTSTFTITVTDFVAATASQEYSVTVN